MKPATDTNAGHKDTAVAHAEIRSHRHTEPYRALIDWLDALIAQVQAAMVACNRDKLADHQIRLQQLIALRDALVAPGGASTGFIF